MTIVEINLDAKLLCKKVETCSHGTNPNNPMAGLPLGIIMGNKAL